MTYNLFDAIGLRAGEVCGAISLRARYAKSATDVHMALPDFQSTDRKVRGSALSYAVEIKYKKPQCDVHCGFLCLISRGVRTVGTNIAYGATRQQTQMRGAR